MVVERERLELSKIYDEIDQSEKILTYEENWNGEGAIPIKKETLERARDLLLRYATKCLDDYGIVIDSPCISPLSDGGVDVEWHTDNYGLLIMMPGEGRPASLYGARRVKPWKWGDGKPPAEMDEIQKEIDVSQVDEELAKWLVESTKFDKERGPAPERQTA